MERKNKSPVWKVFIKDAARKRTVCTLCGKEFKYRYTTTNLRDHLKRYHPEWLPECGMNSTPNEQRIEPAESDIRNALVPVKNQVFEASISEDCETPRKNKSAVWEVFVKDAENKNVTCTICHKEFKFWNNTTNLRAHLRRTHPEWCPGDARQNFDESGDEGDSDYEPDEVEARRSSTSSSGSYAPPNTEVPNADSFVWRVFVKDEANKRVFCTLCQKHFSFLHNTWNMIDHLRRLHPDWEPTSTQTVKICDQDDNDDDTADKVDVSTASNSVFLVNADRKNRSPVWEVFIKDSTNKRTICMLCSKNFKCWNNTANLLDHLRRIHPTWKPGCTSFEEVKIDDANSDRKRPTITRIRNTSALNAVVKPPIQVLPQTLSSSVSTADVKVKRLDRLIGEMICLDFQNLNIVEDNGFKRLMKELVPQYSPPTRKTVVKQIIPEMYDNVSRYLQQELSKCKYVSVSAELWTNLNSDTFITLTVHYYSNDTYTSSVLKTEHIHNDQSFENLANVLHRIFDHWQIFEKITAIVTDDDDVLKAVCNMLNITHIPCIGHMLNTLISEVLTKNADAQVLLQRCQNLVAHFKMNTSACEILHEIQIQMDHPVLNLKQLVLTRWNSALYMFQRLREMKEPLTTTLVALPEGPEPLDTADWLNLEDFISMLKPFELMASELSADSYCNISKVVPLIRGVQSSLQNVPCSSGLGSALKQALLEKLEASFSTYEKYVIPSVATLLDPRFKRAGLGVESAIESTRGFVIEQLSEMKNNSKSTRNENSEKRDNKSLIASSDIWNFLDEKVNEISNQKAPTNSAEVSVTQYLELPYLKRQDCPCKFWVSQSALEPDLADLAMKFMCIPATSFPAERLYSKPGVVIAERRNRITSKHYDAIIFLNKNLTIP